MMDPADVHFGHLDQQSPDNAFLPCSCAMPNCRGMRYNGANDAIHYVARRCMKPQQFRAGALPGVTERSTTSAKLSRHDCPASTSKTRQPLLGVAERSTSKQN